MDIQPLGILDNNTIQENVTTVKNAENDFRKLFERYKPCHNLSELHKLVKRRT